MKVKLYQAIKRENLRTQRKAAKLLEIYAGMTARTELERYIKTEKPYIPDGSVNAIGMADFVAEMLLTPA